MAPFMPHHLDGCRGDLDGNLGHMKLIGDRTELNHPCGQNSYEVRIHQDLWNNRKLVHGEADAPIEPTLSQYWIDDSGGFSRQRDEQMLGLNIAVECQLFAGKGVFPPHGAYPR